MIVIPPYEVDTAVDVLSTTADASAYPAWSSLTRYAIDASVSAGAGKYRAVLAESASTTPGGASIYNENRDPTTNPLVPAGYADSGSPWWEDVTADAYHDNRYAMFGMNPETATVTDGPLTVVLRPSVSWDSLALFGLHADRLEASIQDGPTWNTSQDLRWDDPISDAYPARSSWAAIDLPEVDPATYPTASLRLKLWTLDGRQTRCGVLVIGERVPIGQTLWGTQVGIVDYSRKERDVFGAISVIERGYTETVSFDFVIESDTIAQARTFLASIRATLAAYVGNPDYPESLILGWYRDLAIPVESHVVSRAELEVESTLIDAPPVEATYAASVVFIEPNGSECITSHLGAAEELCLIDGKITRQVTASILDREIAPDETVTWELDWLDGSSTESPTIDSLTTSCGTLPTLTWPPSAPVTHDAAVASIRATITLADESELAVAPAALIVGVCGGTCTAPPEIDSHGWYDSTAETYSLDHLDATASFAGAEIEPDTATAITACAGASRYYWCNLDDTQTLYEWNVTLAGADAANVCMYAALNRIPTTDSASQCGAGSISASCSVSGAAYVVVLVQATDDSADLTLTISGEYGVGMG